MNDDDARDDFTPRDMVLRLYATQALVEYCGLERLAALVDGKLAAHAEAFERQRWALLQVGRWKALIRARYSADMVPSVGLDHNGGGMRRSDP